MAKHAGTDGARVRLSHSGSRLSMIVEDDGQGFEPNGARTGGLVNIRDRVEALHGKLTIESRWREPASAPSSRWPRAP